MKRCSTVVLFCLPFIVAFLAALVLVGCGGHTQNITVGHVTVPPPQASQSVGSPTQCNPPVGQGHLGICTTQPAAAALRVPQSNPPTVAGKFLPDASEFQGAVNWGAAHARGMFGAIVKAYEVNFRQDSQFSHNWHQLSALHIWHAAYLFVRGGSCNGVADTYVNIVKANGGWDFWAGPPILDVEVPSAFGMVPCLMARIHHDTGISTVIVYTAPGTWPGGPNGNAPLWIATYGSSFGCIWTCHPVAWQFTDGHFGPAPHEVYGLPSGDVSVDFGISGMFVHIHNPKPLNPICFTHRITRAQCVAVKNHIVAYTRAETASRGAYNARRCPDLARREAWFANKIKTDHSANGQRLLAHRRGALVATRKTEANRSCKVFGARVAHFTHLIEQAKAAS